MKALQALSPRERFDRLAEEIVECERRMLLLAAMRLATVFELALDSPETSLDDLSRQLGLRPGTLARLLSQARAEKAGIPWRR